METKDTADETKDVGQKFQERIEHLAEVFEKGSRPEIRDAILEGLNEAVERTLGKIGSKAGMVLMTTVLPALNWAKEIIEMWSATRRFEAIAALMKSADTVIAVSASPRTELIGLITQQLNLMSGKSKEQEGK